MSIYLDNAACGFPRPPAVAEAVSAMLARGGNAGRGFTEAARHADETVQACRTELAQLVGIADASRVSFTLNATDALNGAIHGILADGPPGRVLTTALEHNSVLRPLQHALIAGRCAAVEHLPLDEEGRVHPAALQAALGDDVRLVAIHHVSNALGVEQPIAALAGICKARGVPLLVDAAQSAGILEIRCDAWGVDLLAFSGHKALYGPGGVGVLCLGDGVTLPPWRQGGSGGYQSDLALQPPEPPYAYEAGTLNAAGIAGLLAGLRHVRDVGPARVRAHHLNLARRLLASLVVHPNVHVLNSAPEVGVVSFNLEGWEPAEVGRVLDESFGIGVGAGLSCAPAAHRWLGTFPGGAVRASMGLTTREADVDALAEAIEKLAHSEIYS